MLGAIASARRRGEQLLTAAVGAHGAVLERVIAMAPDPDLLERDRELAEVLSVHRPCPPEHELLDGLEHRIDATLEAIEQTGVPGMGEAAARLLEAVDDVYGRALARALEILHRSGLREAVLAAIDDELVSSALILHGLHPLDVETRAVQALERIAATFSPTGPQVTLRGIDPDGTVRLLVDGEPVRDRWRVAVAAERAVAAAAPDAAGVAVDGSDGLDGATETADATAPRAAGNGADGAPATEFFIPLASIGRRNSRTPRRWVEVPELAAVGDNDVVRVRHDDLRLLACRVGADLYVAVDPFDGRDVELRIRPDRPPTVWTPDGDTFVFSDPLPVQHSEDLIEVAVP